MTQLQAINTMLSYVNEMPLSSLTDTLPIEKLAVNILYEEIYSLNTAIGTSYTTFDDMDVSKEILKVYMVRRASKSLFTRTIGFEEKGIEQFMYDIMESTSYVVRYMVDLLLVDYDKVIYNSLPNTESNIKNILDAKTLINKYSGSVAKARRDILGMGWNVNTGAITLQPNIYGYIVIPSNFLNVDAVDDGEDLIVSDWKLFDKTEQTYEFDSGVECNVIYDINTDDLTNTMLNLVLSRAKINVAISLGLDSKTLQTLNMDYAIAMSEAKSEDAMNLDANMLNDEFVTGLVDRTRM